MKVLESSEYYVIEMKEWITIIDLFGDKHFMKQIVERGEGGDRVAIPDEIRWGYSITVG